MSPRVWFTEADLGRTEGDGVEYADLHSRRLMEWMLEHPDSRRTRMVLGYARSVVTLKSVRQRLLAFRPLARR